MLRACFVKDDRAVWCIQPFIGFTLCGCEVQWMGNDLQNQDWNAPKFWSWTTLISFTMDWPGSRLSDRNCRRKVAGSIPVVSKVSEPFCFTRLIMTFRCAQTVWKSSSSVDSNLTMRLWSLFIAISSVFGCPATTAELLVTIYWDRNEDWFPRRAHFYLPNVKVQVEEGLGKFRRRIWCRRFLIFVQNQKSVMTIIPSRSQDGE